MFVRSLLTAVVSLGAGHLAVAQAIHVPGDYPTIQQALDAAPSGAVVIVHGGIWDAITIERPVTLIGDEFPVIGGVSGYFAPIALQGSGKGRVVIQGVAVGGVFTDSFVSARPPAGIQGGGFEELYVSSAAITAPQRPIFDFTGLGYGSSAIDVNVPLVVLDGVSAIGGGAGIDDDCTGSPPEWIPPPAIRAPTLIMIGSSAQGGRNGSFQSHLWPTQADCDPHNCPFLPGGAGIECGVLYYTGSLESVATGGVGATWSACAGGPPCCSSPEGVDIIAGRVVRLADDLAVPERLALGARYTLRLDSPGPTVLLLRASGLRPPVLVRGRGQFFLDPGSTRNLGAIQAPGTVTFFVPPVSSLIGRTVAHQTLDPEKGFSRPVMSVIVPPGL